VPLVLIATLAVHANARAKELFQEGSELYALGDYEAAVKLFEESYELSQQPLLLYNLSRTYENLGQFAKAAKLLRDYLPHADPTERKTLQIRARALEQRAEGVRQQEARRELEEKSRQLDVARELAEAERIKLRTQSEPAVVETAPPVPTPAAVAPRMVEARSAWPGVVLLAVGALGLSGAAWAGVLARRADADTGCDPVCTAADEPLLARRDRYARTATISVVVGGASFAAGLLYLLWPSAPVEAALTPSGHLLLRASF
jgi:tetratricopeptide (TPR) repeat protein